ncbi:DUF2868 domain-containing protein [Bergeriella denitrificans]|uniref:Putative inner membrane protein n=1 Tax=Bergeriella denitrificans TaxID=494 RepID=A0A378UGN9_BERDE|nr:DUF2868 domain-containing protein [Bergeriella denitrificans]STZ76544.1 putative inner membrane protein [Bergeriella denitrificans]
MLNQQRKLAELVRILEEDGHVFPADPEQVTEAMRAVEGGFEQKIIRRAEMVDRNRMLAGSLAQVRAASFWLWVVVASMMFAGGFSGTYLLMDSQGLNFFLILSGVLGMNTLMLLIWLLSVGLRLKPGRMAFSPALWLRGRDPVNQALLRLYADEWRKPAARWLLGATSHSLWLATLSGMLVSVLLLLLVRQYTFGWESTLLSNAASVQAVAWLSWLPAKLGFAVPDAAAVLQGRLNNHIADAAAWSGLLVGSMLVYGIFPRLLAWLVCKILLRAGQSRLPLEKPYYQNIIRRWQVRVVDADTQQERVEAVAPKIHISDAPKWAVTLDAPWADADWFRHALGQDWADGGVLADRDDAAAWLERMQTQPMQLLIGVRAAQVPDRGILRQLVRLAEAAQGGAVVQLLAESDADSLTERLAQWQAALAERGIAWLNPPQWQQAERQRQQQAV